MTIGEIIKSKDKEVYQKLEKMRGNKYETNNRSTYERKKGDRAI